MPLSDTSVIIIKCMSGNEVPGSDASLQDNVSFSSLLKLYPPPKEDRFIQLFTDGGGLK